MTLVRRLIQSESYNRKFLPESASIVYMVLGHMSASDAIRVLQADRHFGIDYNDPHPDRLDPNLVARSFSSSERLSSDTDMGWYITVGFEDLNKIDYSGKEVDNTAENYLAIHFDSQEQDYKFPIFQAKPIKFPVITNDGSDGESPSGGIQTRYVYEEANIPPISRYYQILKITVNVNNDQYKINAFTGSVDSQKGLLHLLPDGNKWLFKGYTTTQKKTDVWSVTYMWERDLGSAGLFNIGSNPMLPIQLPQFSYPFDHSSNEAIPRLPYTDYKITLELVNVTDALGSYEMVYPRIDPSDPYIYPYFESPNGWVRFPGQPVQKAVSSDYVGPV
jgi:hypothetical protein